VFSASSCLRRFNSDALSPPYFAFHA
jgi:hypothetical protein